VDSDESIATAIRRELEEGLRSLTTRREFVGRVTEAKSERFGTTTFELTGRYKELADREVTLVVEVDPARMGWRVEAGLYEYADDEDSQRLVRELGSSRVIDIDRAIENGRGLARAGWAALLIYPALSE